MEVVLSSQIEIVDRFSIDCNVKEFISQWNNIWYLNDMESAISIEIKLIR
jgi:hypothetical protein